MSIDERASNVDADINTSNSTTEQWEALQQVIAATNTNRIKANESPVKINPPPSIQPNGAHLDILSRGNVAQINQVKDQMAAGEVLSALRDRGLRIAPNRATELYIKRIKGVDKLLKYIEEAEENSEDYFDEEVDEIMTEQDNLFILKCVQPAALEVNFKLRIELENFLVKALGPHVLAVAWNNEITVTLTDQASADTLSAGISPQIPQGCFIKVEQQDLHTFRNFVAGPFPSNITPEQFKSCAPGNPVQVYLQSRGGKSFAYVMYASIQEAIIAKKTQNGIFTIGDKLYKMTEALGGQGIGRIYKIILHSRKMFNPKQLANLITSDPVGVASNKLIDIHIDTHSETGKYMGKYIIKVAGIETHDLLLKTRILTKNDVLHFSAPPKFSSKDSNIPTFRNLDHIV